MRPVIALVIFGGGVAQGSFTPVLQVAGVMPDIPLIVVILLALRRGAELGCVAGFAAGLLQDVMAGGFVGAQALTKGLIGFFIGSVGGGLAVHNPLVQVPGLVVLSVVEGLARFLLLQLFHFPPPLGELMLYVVLPQAVYNGFIGAAWVLALTWADTVRDSWR